VKHEASPLRYPAEIYAPFDEGEVFWLRTYVRLVTELTDSSFFNTAKDMSLTIGAETGSPLSEELEYPGEEAVRAIVGPFRQLYNHNERSSFDAVLGILSHRVRERPSPRQRAALDDLRGLKKWKKQALRHQGFAMNLSGWRPGPRDIIDLFFNALYFHPDHEKARVLTGDVPEAVLRFEFLTTVQVLTKAFVVGRQAVQLALDEPSVLPPPSIPAHPQ
jgi:hypothetical protein